MGFKELFIELPQHIADSIERISFADDITVEITISANEGDLHNCCTAVFYEGRFSSIEAIYCWSDNYENSCEIHDFLLNKVFVLRDFVTEWWNKNS